MGIRCNVQCYGRGEIHDEIVKELDISRCEGPRVPCVLFVYKVSHEILDIQNAFHWVTGGGTVRKEDICAVILLQKSPAVREEKMTIDPGLFHEGTKVYRVSWMDSSSWWSRSKTYQCPTVIQTVKQSLIDRIRSRGGSCSGWSEDPQGGKTLSVPNERSASWSSSIWSPETNDSSSEKLNCNESSEDRQGSETSSLSSEQPDHLTSPTGTQEKSEKISEKLQCNVQCYGRGDVHEQIVKELNINQCERPRIPCVLFVYNVSHEIEDFRNALQWVTGGGRVRKEDICAVILLQKSMREGQISTYPGLFHEGTTVHRVLWTETIDILKRRKVQCHCPNTIRAIRQSLSDRNGPREHSSPGSSKDPEGTETSSLSSEQTGNLTSSTNTHEKSEKNAEQPQCNGSSEDPEGTETSPLSSEQTDNLTSSSGTQEKS